MGDEPNPDANSLLSNAFTGRFYKAPVCRLAMYGSIGGYLLINFGAKKLQYFLQCNYENVVLNRQIWRLPLSKLFYTDAKYLAFSIFLLLNFRKFEKRYGSRKFVSYLLTVFMVTQALELFVLVSAHWFDFKLEDLPTGPLSVLFSLFVPFYLDIPRITRASVLGIPITGKALAYFCGLQIASSSVETLLLAGIGLVSGFLFRANFCYMKKWLVIPTSLSSLCHKLLGPLVDVSPPSLPAQYGATLELQQMEEADRIEQAILLSSFRQQRRGHIRHHGVQRGNHFGGLAAWFRQNDDEDMGHVGAVGSGQGAHQPQQQTNVNPSEEMLITLTSMGFSRESATEALTITGNNLNDATNYLLMAN